MCVSYWSEYVKYNLPFKQTHDAAFFFPTLTSSLFSISDTDTYCMPELWMFHTASHLSHYPSMRVLPLAFCSMTQSFNERINTKWARGNPAGTAVSKRNTMCTAPPNQLQRRISGSCTSLGCTQLVHLNRCCFDFALATVLKLSCGLR